MKQTLPELRDSSNPPIKKYQRVRSDNQNRAGHGIALELAFRLRSVALATGRKGC